MLFVFPPVNETSSAKGKAEGSKIKQLGIIEQRKRIHLPFRKLTLTLHMICRLLHVHTIAACWRCINFALLLISTTLRIIWS